MGRLISNIPIAWSVDLITLSSHLFSALPPGLIFVRKSGLSVTQLNIFLLGRLIAWPQTLEKGLQNLLGDRGLGKDFRGISPVFADIRTVFSAY